MLDRVWFSFLLGKDTGIFSFIQDVCSYCLRRPTFCRDTKSRQKSLSLKCREGLYEVWVRIEQNHPYQPAWFPPRRLFHKPLPLTPFLPTTNHTKAHPTGRLFVFLLARFKNPDSFHLKLSSVPSLEKGDREISVAGAVEVSWPSVDFRGPS